MSTLPQDSRPVFVPLGDREEYSQRPVNFSVLRSETRSRFLSRYGEIEMEIEIVVPACTTKKNYLHHPDCEAHKVAELIRKGLSTTAIARELGVSEFIVGRVTKFLEMEPNPDRIDLLNHPRCPAQASWELREAGLTFEAIGERFGVSHELVRRVLRTVSERDGIPIPSSAPRPPRADFYLNHPLCPAQASWDLRKAGLTYNEIGKQFGVSQPVVLMVLRAVSKRDGIPIPTAPRKQRQKEDNEGARLLKHPRCPAEASWELRMAGLSFHEIGARFGASDKVARRVLRAVSERDGIPIPPVGPRPSRLDPLQHPRCPAQTTWNLRQVGLTYTEIGKQLGVSSPIVQAVLRAVSARDGIPIPTAPRKQRHKEGSEGNCCDRQTFAGEAPQPPSHEVSI